MKIVLNKCYGGFMLSHLAYERLLKLGVPSYKSYQDIPDPRKPYILVNDDLLNREKYISNFFLDEHRSNPLLIQVVEELGTAASGVFSELKVVEIPDDVEWEMECFDGIETIREISRTW